MDGVIIDSQSIGDKLLKATCETLGIFLKDEELQQFVGASSRRFWAQMKNAYALPESVDFYCSLYNVEAEIRAYETLSVDDGSDFVLAVSQRARDKNSRGNISVAKTDACRHADFWPSQLFQCIRV